MTRRILVALAMFGLLLTTGCSTLTKDKGGTKKDSSWGPIQFWKKEYQQPVKMAVLWSHDILTVAGQPPTRGFGGRIYFYNNKSQTIPVEGELVVHGYDETKRKTTGSSETQADKRFRFTAEQFTEHFSQSDLGASYSVWIPWDAVDGVQKEITLIPTFISSKGETVQGAPAKVMLPGRTQPAGPVIPGQAPSQQPVQTVSYEQSTIPTVEGKLPQLTLPVKDTDKLMSGYRENNQRTTTINLPPRARRPAAPTPNQPTQTNSSQSQTQPALSMIDQARAQALAEAFRNPEPMPQRPYQPATPAQSYGAWSPNTAPMASSLTINANMVTAPGAMPVQLAPPVQNAAQNTTPHAGQPPVQPPALHPSAQFSSGPTQSDEYPGPLPPGFQFSPRATAW